MSKIDCRNNRIIVSQSINGDWSGAIYLDEEDTEIHGWYYAYCRQGVTDYIPCGPEVLNVIIRMCRNEDTRLSGTHSKGMV